MGISLSSRSGVCTLRFQEWHYAVTNIAGSLASVRSDLATMYSVVALVRPPPIERHIAQLAGVVSPKSIIVLSAQVAEISFQSKLVGEHQQLALITLLPVRTVHLLSSFASRHSSLGSIACSVVNVCLSSVAEHNQDSIRFPDTVPMGAWLDVGVATQPSSLEILSAQGLSLVASQKDLSMFFSMANLVPGTAL